MIFKQRRYRAYVQGMLVINLALGILLGGGVQEAGPVPPNDSVVMANVLGYAILSSQVESIQPEQVLHALWLELLRSEDVPGLPNFTRRYVGTIIKVLSKESLSPYLFEKTIQAHVEFVGDERGGKFWIRDISVSRVP